MASAEEETAVLCVDGITAMRDAELGQFMAKHRRPDGLYDLPVDGWDKLSKEERNNLADRLRAQEQDLARNPATCSRPLDLDDLDARLRQVPADNRFFLRPVPQEHERPDLVDIEHARTRYEIESYHELIKDGGRPLYPVDIIREVFRNPGNYAEILRPWQETLTEIHPERIFQRQLRRWEDFRKWQIDNRGLEDDDGGFPAYVERRKHGIKQFYLPGSAAKRLAEIEADPLCLKADWDAKQWEREEQRYRCREHGCHGLRDYALAAKRRLARHDFTRPLQLHEDPKQQDALTTWIEYLDFEYWWLDEHTREMERLEPGHDKAWQELVDDGVLKPHETKEFVRTVASPMERQAEEDVARKAVQRLEAEAKKIYSLTQEDPQRLRIPRAKRISMLQAGRIKLLAAKRRLEEIRSRNDRITSFIRETFGYAGAKKDAALLSNLRLPWVLEQIPLIEGQQSRPPDSEVESVNSKRKRSRAVGQEEEGNPEFKKQKLDQQGSGQPARRASPRVTSKARPDHLTMTGQEAAVDDYHDRDVGTTSRRPRRSARIAARRETSREALEPANSRPRRRPKPGSRTPAQPPAAQLDARGAKVSAAMGRRLRGGGRRDVARPTGTSRRPRRQRCGR